VVLVFLRHSVCQVIRLHSPTSRGLSRMTFSSVLYTGLYVSGATYRFRVVATVTNGDIRQSPSSEKVYMTSDVHVQRQTETLLPAPVIVESQALSRTEIFIGWQVSHTQLHAAVHNVIIISAIF